MLMLSLVINVYEIEVNQCIASMQRRFQFESKLYIVYLTSMVQLQLADLL